MTPTDVYMIRGDQYNLRNTCKRYIMIRGQIIILVVACGAYLVQGSPMSNVNSNANTNVWTRRNSNTNSNTNVVLGSSKPSQSPYRDDNDIDDPNSLSENVRRKLYDENDPTTASVASAAGDAALSITKTLVEDLSSNVAVEVANAVAKIMKSQSARAIYARRNYNSNTNMNINGYGFNNPREPQRSQGSNGLRQDSDFLRGYGGSQRDWAYDQRRIPQGRGTGGYFHDDDEPVEEIEEPETTEIISSLEVASEEEEEEEKVVTSKPLPSNGWGPISLPVHSDNSNSNANNNRIDSGRDPNAQSDDRDDDANRFMTNRRNFNGKFNGNRRAANPNTIRGLRGNANSNSNNNRIDRGRGYRRD